MFRTIRSAMGVLGVAGLAAACSTAPPDISSPGPGAGRYRVGVPYQIGDTWYYPHEDPNYDETGIASWYGPMFYGKPTADGEIYTGDGLTAAHKTLPMPVNVRVTNLENGKSLVLRVNDRGPFAQGRIIDVSKHAAELLGFYQKGTARVRVTYLGRADTPSAVPPDDIELASSLREAARARHKLAAAAPSQRAAPTKAMAMQPVQVASLDTAAGARPPQAGFDATAVSTGSAPTASSASEAATHLYVQAGAFSSRDNAERLKERIGPPGDVFISAAERHGEPLYLVRSGPYDDLETANAALARMSELVNNGARIVVDR